MKRTNWSTATFAGGVTAATALTDDELRWLCGCGRTKSFRRSKAYPICRCKRRMRMLDHPKLGYARGAK